MISRELDTISAILLNMVGFKEQLQALMTKLQSDDPYGPFIERAAARRTSMDLTRLLAQFRRGGC